MWKIKGTIVVIKTTKVPCENNSTKYGIKTKLSLHI